MKLSVVLLAGASTASAASWLSWPSWLSWESRSNKQSDPKPYSGLDGSADPDMPEVTIVIEGLSMSPEKMSGVVTVAMDYAKNSLHGISNVPQPTFTTTPTSFTTITTAPPTITDAPVLQGEGEFEEINLDVRKRGRVGDKDANGRPWIEYAANLFSTTTAPATTAKLFQLDSDKEDDEEDEEEELIFDMSLTDKRAVVPPQ